LRDHARRQAAEARALERREAAEPIDGTVSPLDAIGRHDDLYLALDTLSGEEREALALRFGADLTVPEIARLTKEPLTTIEGRVYRALRKLRDELREEPEAVQPEARSGIESLVRISG
jgi:RNA polymerase sigma-70 factor (ECF subfamily)